MFDKNKKPINNYFLSTFGPRESVNFNSNRVFHFYKNVCTDRERTVVTLSYTVFCLYRPRIIFTFADMLIVGDRSRQDSVQKRYKT